MRPFVFLGAALVAAGQDDEKAVRAKIKECVKTLGSKDQGEQISAVGLLATFSVDEARHALAKALLSQFPAVRHAAAAAVAKQKHPQAIKALAAAATVFVKDKTTIKAIIDALVQLDMCDGNGPLVFLLEAEKHAYSADALDAIGRIGCPLEAAPAVVALLKKAEDMDAQPNDFAGTPNLAKDRVLVDLRDKINSCLGRISGKTYKTHKEWSAWLKGELGALKFTRTFLCESSNDQFDVASNQQPKCPTQDAKKGHKDMFLKHRREGEMVGK